MKRTAALASLLMLVMTMVLTSEGTASAATSAKQKYVTVTKPYVQNWVYRSKSLKACIFVEVRGSVRGTHRYAYHDSTGTGWDTRTFYWYNTKLLSPSVRAVGWPIRGAGCDSTKRVAFKKLTLTQSWYEGSCKLSVAVSAGAPWSVSATPTYSCGSHRVAHRSTSDEYPGSAGLTQANGGSPVYFKGAYLAGSKARNPFRGNLRVTAARAIGKGTVSDTFATKGAVAYL